MAKEGGGIGRCREETGGIGGLVQRRYREHMQWGGPGRAGVSQGTCCCKSKLLLAPGLLTGTVRTRREPKHKRVTCLHPIRVKTQSWIARNWRDRIWVKSQPLSQFLLPWFPATGTGAHNTPDGQRGCYLHTYHQTL